VEGIFATYDFSFLKNGLGDASVAGLSEFQFLGGDFRCTPRKGF
jgi:hypothetical protein